MKVDLEKLKKLILKLNEAKVLVIGDLALDEMVYGDTERISREAPVLILQHTHTKYILGGASNAAHNVATLNNGKVSVIGVIGNDYQAEDLKNAFKEANIDCSSLIVDESRKTITKTRISGSCSHSITQQIVRIDRQTNAPVSKKTEDDLISAFEKLIPQHDIVILSDYHIGTLSDRVIESIVNISNKYSKKVIVDAQKELNRYKGVCSMTPNLPDTQKHVGFYLNNKEDFIKAGKKIIEQVGADSILITNNNHSMLIDAGNNEDGPLFLIKQRSLM